MNNLPTPEQIITSNVKPKSTIILAISGGIDSVYLLSICQKLHKTHPFKIVIAHIDHNYRKQSKTDSEFVKSLAEKHKIPFELKILPKMGSGNLEEKFRNARYKFFESISKKHHAEWIVLGHHLNDNIETLLLNLTRGASINGLGGMDISDKKRHILRPLIYTTKEEILQKSRKLKLKHVEDASNKDPHFSRNRIRISIIPELKKINPSIEKTFLNNILLFQQTKNSINSHIKQWLSNHLHKNKMSLTEFLQLPPAFQSSVLAQIYKKLYKSTTKFNTQHLKQVMTIINKQHCNRKKEFGDNYFVCIERDPNGKTKHIAFHQKLEKKR